MPWLVASITALLLFFGQAAAEVPLVQKVEEAVRRSALLSDDAEVRIAEITPVRGRVETVEVTRFDRRTGRFDARIALGATSARISGRAVVSVPVVAAVRTLRRGHTLGLDDLELRYVPLGQVPGEVFILPEDLEGFAVRRSLAAGRPIRAQDVGAPLVVAKNAAVEIIYDRSGVTLSSMGRALDEGAIGDLVRVQAKGQDRQVSAEIVAPGRVIIR
ncbi:flagellar basal body P-ring formation chaperone FlgA [Parvularcula maris]|uniref:Flagella basal body P-ring formation protein FlgA n=1 Tax=Parvularcula maris TaxID=2965077 RepID=A0A9X2L9H4_9PROT|nr:flagellar basal body P-ring formation chaperone FlgA [Parvularcula maris]MCQ8185517.1 flagellar basal body P-ring formation chaperone FlgA [Parvularcula maris]